MGVCASLAACLCFLVRLCLLCFEANKYDDDDEPQVCRLTTPYYCGGLLKPKISEEFYDRTWSSND